MKKVYVNSNGKVLTINNKALKIEEPFLTFSSPNSFTLNVVDNTKHWDGTLEYSTDKTNWSVWDGTTTLSSTSNGTFYNLYLRGTGNTYITHDTHSNIDTGVYYWVLNGSEIYCSGNIENLLDYVTVLQKNHPPMSNGCFSIQ